ncbi:hypothetical protein R1flu_016105 [Riccia fluitans]|uniref:E2 ubiquitin-conjugating enzyme n=1 Tax=Riccia fluitans TaxID=41844 RepID=A0ABD1YP09_9MARC
MVQVSSAGLAVQRCECIALVHCCSRSPCASLLAVCLGSSLLSSPLLPRSTVRHCGFQRSFGLIAVIQLVYHHLMVEKRILLFLLCQGMPYFVLPFVATSTRPKASSPLNRFHRLSKSWRIRRARGLPSLAARGRISALQRGERKFVKGKSFVVAHQREDQPQDMATNENLPPKVIKKLARELKSLDESPPEDIRVIVNEENFSTIFADIEGPHGTPYEGGVFRMKLVLNEDFPQTPPKGYFITRIFHPNIAKNGKICVNTLKKDWKPTLGLRHVLLVVRCLLIEPFPESALNEEAGKMLMEDYQGYAKHARLMTSIHAMKLKAKAKVAIAESTSVNASSLERDTMSHSPPMHITADKDLSPEGGLSVASLDAITTSNSPSAKKPKGEIASVKPVVDKKKIDVRKKSLKRL